MTPKSPFRPSRRLPAIVALLLAACAGGPQPPDWQVAAHASLAAYSTAWLAGESRVADAEFRRTRGELARTGRADLVARAELTRCALQLAALDLAAAEECPGFAPIAADAGDEARAYAAFLAGRSDAATIARLPEVYRALAAGRSDGLAQIASPLSRLIAAATLLRAGRLTPEGLSLAVDTAAAEGWRRPLLAWLAAQVRLAEGRGDTASAERARRRMALIEGR